MTIPINDSTEKIITRYLSAVTTRSFVYGGIIFKPKPLQVSSDIFVKRMKCVLHCGGCCPKFSLDYLPEEYKTLPDELQQKLEQRFVIFNNQNFSIYSDLQRERSSYHCKHLSDDASCSIHGNHPFSCDFELLRFKSGKEKNWLGHTPFGRGWALMRLDGERGALCEWREEQCSDEWKEEVIRKLERLKKWGDYFRVKTVLPNIIKWVGCGPHPSSLLIDSEKKGFGL